MVRTGLQTLIEDPSFSRLVEGRNVGLLVNPVSVDPRLRHAVEVAHEAGWRLVRLFGPEHGVRGEAQDMEAVSEQVDRISGLPCVSLYGSTEDSLRPTPDMFHGVDVFVIDLQDIGARYYTYAYTAAFCAEVCGELGIDVVVCDRPNPLGGEVLEGNVVLEDLRSFVGAYAMATRHAMTMGEVLTLLVGDVCNLSVVPMQGWSRDMWYDDTGLEFVMPSPNMPTLTTTMVYPGMCLLEGTNLSEGRGTTRPFELFGAPWLDAGRLAGMLQGRGLPGCSFRLASFRPTFQKHAGQTCSGLQLHVTDRNAFRSVHVALAILQDILSLHPDEFVWRTHTYEFVQDRLAIDLLLGDSLLRHALMDGTDVVDIIVSMDASRRDFEEARQQALAY